MLPNSGDCVLIYLRIPLTKGENIMVRDHLQKTAKKMKDKIYLALISEVYFTRTMDITLACTKN